MRGGVASLSNFDADLQVYDIDDRALLNRLREHIEAEAARHKDARISRWKHDMDESLRACVKWVMKEPAKGSSTEDPHPSKRAAAFYKEMCSKWVDDVGAYERRWGNDVEDWAAGAGTKAADPDENADDLRRAARQGRWTAAGADGWRPGHLAMRPPEWWQLAAELWRMATRTGALPEAWMHTRIVGIDKADGGVRPISVAAAMLRIGISAMLERLRDWMVSWTPTEVVGGVPGRDASWILNDLGGDIRRSTMEDGDLVGIKARHQSMLRGHSGPLEAVGRS